MSVWWKPLAQEVGGVECEETPKGDLRITVERPRHRVLHGLQIERVDRCHMMCPAPIGGPHTARRPLHDQVHVAELVPQIAEPERFVVRCAQVMWSDEGAEQVQMAGLRLVETGEQAIDRAQVCPRRDP